MEARKKKIDYAKMRLDAVKTIISNEISVPISLKKVQSNSYIKVE